MATIIDIPSSEVARSAGDNHPDGTIPKVAVMAIMFGSSGVLDFPIALQSPQPNGRFFQASLVYKAYCTLMFVVFVTGLLMLLLSFFPPGGGGQGRNSSLRSLRKKLMWVALAAAPLALGLGLYLILYTTSTTTA